MSVLDMGWEPRLVRPEYTPKPRLSPPGAERVGQVLQLAVHDRDAVEPIDVRRPPEAVHPDPRRLHELAPLRARQDRKSTRLNSSHLVISYAVFCLKKKKTLIT